MAAPSVPYASCWLCHWRAYAGEANDYFLASLRLFSLNFLLEDIWQVDHRAGGVDLHHTDNCACVSSVHSECELAALCLPWPLITTEVEQGEQPEMLTVEWLMLSAPW